MVIANPMLVTIVKAVPLYSGMAVCAIKVENCGESAITQMPHRSIINVKAVTGHRKKLRDAKQHNPEHNKA